MALLVYAFMSGGRRLNRWKLEFSKPSLTRYITRVLHGMSLSVFDLIHTFETCYFPLWISPLGRSRDPKVFTPTFPVFDGDFTYADMAHPPPGLLGNRSGKHIDSARGHIPTFFQAQSAQTRQVNGLLVDVNGTGQSKTAKPLPFRFEGGITGRAFPLPLFFELHPPKEIGEGHIQIPQSLLWSAFADFVHPGKFSLLELVQLTMKLHRADAPARSLVDLLLAFQAPVVRIAGSPGVLLAGRDLLVIQVQFGAIAPCDLHDGFSPKMC